MLEKALDRHLNDAFKTASSVEKVHKLLNKKGKASEEEAAKHVKPLYALALKIEKSQKALTAEILKQQNLLGELNQSADPTAQKLIKRGQMMDAAGKKYIAYAKSTQKKGTEFLDKLAKNELKNVKDAFNAFSTIYVDFNHEKYSDHWFDLSEQVKK